jgi:hypothetical protein
MIMAAGPAFADKGDGLEARVFGHGTAGLFAKTVHHVQIRPAAAPRLIGDLDQHTWR